MGKKSIRAIAFILRCSGAATVGYELASALGLHEAVWAAMSAVIVSEERLHETRSSLLGRIFRTLLGIGVTVGVSETGVVQSSKHELEPLTRAAALDTIALGARLLFAYRQTTERTIVAAER